MNEQAYTDMKAVAAHLADLFVILSANIFSTADVAAKYNLTATKLLVLFALRTNNLPTGNLANAIGIAKPNMTPVVKSMVEDGLLIKIPDEQDHRVVLVGLTEKSIDLVSQILDYAADKISDSFLLSKSKQKALINSLSFLNRE